MGRIALPVIIVDGQLFDAHLNPAHELAVLPKSDGVLDWSNPVGGKQPTWIRVVTETGLATFIADAVETVRYLEEECDVIADDIDRIWKRDRDSQRE